MRDRMTAPSDHLGADALIDSATAVAPNTGDLSGWLGPLNGMFARVAAPAFPQRNPGQDELSRLTASCHHP
jgi:hypothetical protein